MGKYLITGRAGSGKSAVTRELKRRGFLAFDSDDVVGLSGWHDRKTEKLIQVSDNSYVNLDKLHWTWNEVRVQDLVKDNESFFLCGGAENDLSFAPLFDGCLVLDVTPDNQISRVKNRTDNNYGQDPRMFSRLIENQRLHLLSALANGATSINADLPIQVVVSQIINYTHEH